MKLERIQQSIDKWERFKKAIAGKQEGVHEYDYGYYQHMFWNSCPYCSECGNDCDFCILHRKISSEHMPFCDNQPRNGSIAAIAIRLADKAQYKEAEKYANLLIAEMQRHLEEVKENEKP